MGKRGKPERRTFDMKRYLAEWLADELARKKALPVKPPTPHKAEYTDNFLDQVIALWERKQHEAADLPNILYALSQRQPLPQSHLVTLVSRAWPIHRYILETPDADLNHNPGIRKAGNTLIRWGAIEPNGCPTMLGECLLAALKRGPLIPPGRPDADSIDGWYTLGGTQ